MWPPSLSIRPNIPWFNVFGRTLEYLEASFLNIFLHVIPSKRHLRNRTKKTLLRTLSRLKSDSNITLIISPSNVILYFCLSYKTVSSLTMLTVLFISVFLGKSG